jgi:SM-20-related protein
MTQSDPAGTEWGRWIAPRHQAEAPGARHRLTAAPGWAIWDDFLVGDKADALHAALAEGCRLRRVYALQGREGRVDRDEFLAAPDHKRFYTHSEYDGPVPGRELDRAHVTHLFFRQVLGSAPALGWFSRASGVPLESLEVVTGKVLKPGDFLRPHADNKPGRGLCGVLYVSAGWRPEDGGQFQLFEDGRVRDEIAPLFNRLLLFIPSAASVHAVAALAPATRQWRMNYSFWFRTQEVP